LTVIGFRLSVRAAGLVPADFRSGEEDESGLSSEIRIDAGNTVRHNEGPMCWESVMQHSSAVQSPVVVQTPGVCGGRARIDGTRIAVWILESLRQQGADRREIAGLYPRLSAEQVEAALQWAADHSEQIAADLAAQVPA